MEVLKPDLEYAWELFTFQGKHLTFEGQMSKECTTLFISCRFYRPLSFRCTESLGCRSAVEEYVGYEKKASDG